MKLLYKKIINETEDNSETDNTKHYLQFILCIILIIFPLIVGLIGNITILVYNTIS